MRARAAGLVAALCLLLAGCSSGPGSVRAAGDPEVRATPGWLGAERVPPTSPARPAPLVREQPVRAQAVSPSSLLPYGSCADYLASVKREAIAQVGPWGLSGGPMAVGVAAATRSAGSPAAATADGTTAGQQFSGTNNQEAGVDEADVVKTDGRLLVAVRQQPVGVQVVDVRAGEPRLRGFLGLGDDVWSPQLLLVDGRVVVLGSGGRQTGDRYESYVSVRVLSLADPDRPRVERAFEVEGWLTAARAVQGRVLLVTQSQPDLRWSYPTADSERARRAATLRNRAVIRATTLDDWLPSVRSTGTGRRHLASCDSAMHPQSSAGAGTTSLLSLDPGSDRPGAQVTVSGSGSVVYASTRSVYVGTWPWEAQVRSTSADEADVTTDLHRFDVSDPAAPAYAGSGSVPGTLIGQYALSEHAGHLRVASTLGRTWAMQDEAEPPSDNLVTVLRADADRLVRVGQVRGLGRGERIYGVRFMGELGYVVTFRQTDPLYVLDLSDPARPVRRGELHVTGYSSYLHPLGSGLLLGIGQEVAENRAQGTQVSTFDVRDPLRPRLESRLVFDRSWSTAEHDPHAVLWWPASRLVVVPMEVYEDAPGGRPQQWSGVVALRVAADGTLRRVARLSHPDDTPSRDARAPECCWGGILRSVVVGDALLTLSERGVLAVDLDTFEVRQWSPYR